MSKITIAVLRWEDGWRVVRAGRRAGSHAFKVDAEEAGLRLANQARASGRDVELLVQDEKTSEVRQMAGWEPAH